MRLILVVAAVAALPSVVAAETLSLVCRGEIKTTETATATSMEQWNGNHDHFPQLKSASISRQVTKPAQYQIVIKDGAGEVVSGRTGYSFPFKELTVGEREITGQIKLNFMAFRDVTINRQTGDIRIPGMFTGTCEKAPDESAPNKF